MNAKEYDEEIRDLILGLFFRPLDHPHNVQIKKGEDNIHLAPIRSAFVNTLSANKHQRYLWNKSNKQNANYTR